jgi:hypothetical protein
VIFVRIDAAQAYVESLLERLTDTDKVLADGDGDYPVGFRGSRYYVRVIDSDNAVVQVFAIALTNIESSPELLSTLNELNADLRFARAFHVRGQVLIETDILADALDPAGFSNACNIVGGVNAEVGPKLQSQFGGQLFPTPRPSKNPESAAVEEDRAPGLYL